MGSPDVAKTPENALLAFSGVFVFGRFCFRAFLFSGVFVFGRFAAVAHRFPAWKANAMFTKHAPKMI